MTWGGRTQVRVQWDGGRPLEVRAAASRRSASRAAPSCRPDTTPCLPMLPRPEAKRSETCRVQRCEVYNRVKRDLLYINI
jgi:hypothetical protein